MIGSGAMKSFRSDVNGADERVCICSWPKLKQLSPPLRPASTLLRLSAASPNVSAVVNSVGDGFVLGSPSPSGSKSR
jgi:hypothetical protein